ncbi:MAG: MATE family efflux transporter [Ruminococcaceae bacterium]|nr:MATE family efflux transporter [Oscillospiraceae bacterium]
MANARSAAIAKNDLTQGNILKKIIMFALPVLGGSIFTQLYNVVDSIVVGQFVGASALAAVGSSFTISMLCNSIFAGLGGGSSVLCSQYYGAGQKEELGDMVATTYTLGLIIGAILTVVGILIARPVLMLLNTPADILDNSVIYLQIVFAGSIGHLFYNMGAAVLRGLGDAKWPMYFLIVCSVINVILDLLFVVVFHWGVAGVAWATIIAQTVSAVGVVWRTVRGGYGFKLSFKMLRVNGKKALALCRIGIPTALSMLISSMGMLVIQRYNNGFGSNFVATMTIVQKVDGFAMLPIQAIGMSATTFVGQNLGAGRDDRVKQGIRIISTSVIILGVVMGLAMYFFGYQLSGAFTTEPAVMEMSRNCLRIVCFMYWAMGLQMTFQGVMRGAGAATVPMIISFVCMIVRIPVAYFIAVRPNYYQGMLISMVISTMLGAFILFLFYKFSNWKKHVVIRKAPAAPAAKEE